MSIQPVDAVLLGAGMRGFCTFGGYAKSFPNNLRFVGVAEPDPVRRKRFVEEHSIPAQNAFSSWEELLERPQTAEILINATMDLDHFPSTMKALDAGYHILLEKPMATDACSCVQLMRKVEETGKIVQLCHSLRYNPFFVRLKKILESPDVGDVVSIMHNENIAYWHYAHSFVRGNWSNEERSSPGLLSKSCHDIDILYWLAQKLPARVSSFGSQMHFTSDNAGEDIPQRCTDGCPIESSCPYSAIRMYLGDNIDWPINTISSDLSYEGRLQALREGPYGRCVYRCDNTIVDHQITTFEYDDGMTTGFNMHGHSHDNVRTLRISCSQATIRGFLEKRELEVNYYDDGRQEIIHTGGPDDLHGGGDTLMIHDFIDLVRRGRPDQVIASAKQSCESHLIVFAAERSRKTNRMFHIPTFIKQVNQDLEKSEKK
ncbi:MAG: Gfo/Idh/MocA family oxidoreductase [Candidatus Omnitrophica bacterium]|nr:Gfo/Idh/MocA family oxidoreductase [Candidatus Omnitrophota bacterium]